MATKKSKGGVRESLSSFSESVGGYWSKSNSDFEKSNPSPAKRVGRVVNPVTGFGSAVGMMYDAASAGDKKGMAIAAASAIPAVGYARTIQAAKSLKPLADVARKVSDIPRTAKGAATNTAVGVAADKYEVSERPPMSKKWVEKK